MPVVTDSSEPRDLLPSSLAAQSTVRLVRVRPEPIRRSHRHPQSEEIIYVLEGKGFLWEAQEVTPIEADDVVYIPPNVDHVTFAAHGESLKLLCLFPHPELAENYVSEGDVRMDPAGDWERR